MKPLVDWIAHHRAFWTERAGRLEQSLEEMDDMNPTDTTAPSQTESVSFEFDLHPAPEKAWRAGARHGWKMMGGKLVDLRARTA